MNCITQAKDLLKLHSGACSVQADSPTGRAFLLLQASGDVTISKNSTPGYIDIYSKDFQPKRTTEDE